MTTDPNSDAGALPRQLPTGAKPQVESGKREKPRPNSILELIEYAYGEKGRRLTLARRDLGELQLDADAAEVEVSAVRRLASTDPFLAVPPSLLLTLAELGAETSVRRRILELVLAALASHPLFEGKAAKLADPSAQPPLTAQEVSEAAKAVPIDILGLKAAPDVKQQSARERLRVNAVMAFELFRVIRDGWTVDRLVSDLATLVWDTPAYGHAPKAAATLVAAKNTDALSQLSRHFEKLLRDAERATRDMQALAMEQKRRADAAESSNRSLTKELATDRDRAGALQRQVEDLTRRLATEQHSRVVDRSHLVDDFEILRTRVIRKLSAQIDLLSDGLHALRNGSPEVTDEFLDRALLAFQQEVDALKEWNGGAK